MLAIAIRLFSACLQQDKVLLRREVSIVEMVLSGIRPPFNVSVECIDAARRRRAGDSDASEEE